MSQDAAKFHIGQIVFYVPDTGKQGVVTAVTFSAIVITYRVAWNDFVERAHYDVELCLEMTFANKTD
jgi:hypothetical protein